MSIKDRVGKGAVWIGVTRLIVNLLGFVSVIVLARLLTPEDYGLVAIAAAMLAVTMSLTELSLASALVHHEAPLADHFHTAWTIAFARSGVIAIAFCIAAYPIALLYNDPRLTGVMIVVGLTGALQGMTNPKLVTLSRKLIFWQDFVVQVSQKLIGFVVGIAIAYFYRTYWALVLGSAAATMFSILLSYVIVPYLPKLRLTHARELFGFSLWLSLGSALNTLNWRFDQFVIGYFFGKHSLGLYTVADNLSLLPTRETTTPISQTLFPAFANLRNHPDQLRRAYQLGQSTICAIALPMGFGMALIAHPLILLTLGPKWLDAVPIMQILAGTFAFQTLSTSLQPLAMAKGATRMLFVRDTRNFILRIPLIVGGMLAGGMMGIVIGRSISSFIATILNMQMVTRLTGLKIADQFKANTRALCAVVAMGAAVLAIRPLLADATPIWQIAQSILVGGVSYVGTIAALWAVTGYPPGPEAEAVRVFRALSRRIRPARVSQS